MFCSFDKLFDELFFASLKNQFKFKFSVYQTDMID